MPGRKSMQNFETIVIGAGPGGYAAALRAAQLGQQVLLVEKAQVGGTCLHDGCISSKAMLEAAAIKYQLAYIEKLGKIHTGIALDLAKLQTWKNLLTDRVQQNVQNLLEKKNVTITTGEASFVDRNKIAITGNEPFNAKFEHAIIATGAQPQKIGRYKIDHKILVTPVEALQLQNIPTQMVIFAADVMAVELAILWQKMGSKVYLLSLENSFKYIEPEIRDILLENFKMLGGKFYRNIEDIRIHKNKKDAEITFTTARGEKNVTADLVILYAAYLPNTALLHLANAEIEFDANGFVSVDAGLHTTNPAVFAVGDIVNGKRGSYRASLMGKMVVESINGEQEDFCESMIPQVIFGDPEFVSVGLTEKQAEENGYKVISSIFPIQAYTRYISLGQPNGLTKVVTDKRNGDVLGVHMVGPHALQHIMSSSQAVYNHAPLNHQVFDQSEHNSRPLNIEQTTEQLLKHAINIFLPAQKRTTTQAYV